MTYSFIKHYSKPALVLLFFVIISTFYFQLSTNLTHAALISKAPNNLELTGYWPMDEGISTQVGDYSGGQNNGTLSGATLPAWVSGKRGNALYFDGISSRVNLGNITTASTTSVSVWIKTSSAGQKPILSNRGSGAYIGISGGRFFIYDNSATPASLTSTRSINNNEWHFLVWTSNSATSTLYIDGILDTTTSQIRGPDTGTGYIGFDSPNLEYFPGYIDDLRLYNRALSATEVVNSYKSGQITRKVVTNQGLVGYWSFNDGRGLTAGDSSGNNNTVTLTGTTTPTWVPGKKGSALSFDGISSRAVISGPTMVPSGATQFTVAAWAKKNTSAGGMVAYKNGPFFLNMGTVLGNSGFVVHTSGGWAGAQGVTNLNVGQWYHLALTYNSNNSLISVYVNGKLDGTGVQTGGIGSAIDCIGIGYSSDSGCSVSNTSYFNGSVDDLRLYNRALTASEIYNLYKQNETKLNSSQNSRITNGLVGFWSFNGPDYDKASTTAEVLDRSGQGNNGDAVNNSLPSLGKVGQGLSFDGSTTYVDTGTKFPSLTSEISISLWVNPSATQVTYADIVGNHQPDFKGMVIQQNAGNTNQYTWGYGDGSGWSNTTGNFNLTANVWQLLTVVKDANYCYAYINGVEQVSARASCSAAIAPATSMNFRIGMGFSGGGRNWIGSVDEVRVYNRAITVDEIKQLYNMGK